MRLTRRLNGGLAWKDVVVSERRVSRASEKNNKIMVNDPHTPEPTGIYEKTGGENTTLPPFTVRNFIFFGGFFRQLTVQKN